MFLLNLFCADVNMAWFCTHTASFMVRRKILKASVIPSWPITALRLKDCVDIKLTALAGEAALLSPAALGCRFFHWYS